MQKRNFKAAGLSLIILSSVLSLSACAEAGNNGFSASEKAEVESSASDSGITNAPAEFSSAASSEVSSSSAENSSEAEVEEVPGQFGNEITQNEIHTGAVYLDSGLVSMTDASSRDETNSLLMADTKIRTSDYDIDLGTFFDNTALEYFVSDYARQLNIYDLEDYSFAGDGLMYVIQVSDSVPANLTGNHKYFGCLTKKSDNRPYYITAIDAGFSDSIADQIQSHFAPSDSYDFHPAAENCFEDGTYYFVARSIDKKSGTITGTLELPSKAPEIPDLPWKEFTDSNYIRYRTCDILSADDSISNGMLETIKKYSDNKQLFVQEINTSRCGGIKNNEDGGYYFYSLDHPELPMLDTLVINMSFSIDQAVFIKTGSKIQMTAKDFFSDASVLSEDSLCKIELENGVLTKVEILGYTQPVN